MKRLSATLISCLILLCTTMSVPALAEVKEQAQQSSTSALQDALTNVTDGIQSVLDGAKANISELLDSSEALSVPETENAQTAADASTREVDGNRADSLTLSNVVPSSISGVVWNADYTTCTLQAGTSVGGSNLQSEIASHKSTLATFIAEDNTVLTGSAERLFFECSSLSTVNLASSFDTSGVNNMAEMFRGCSSLSSLTLPAAFDTSAVDQYMGGMFYGCSSLSSLTLPDSFNTSKVTNMSDMFYGCSSLSSLTLPDSFNTSEVTGMNNMFYGCSELSSLALPAAFDTSSVDDMSAMFQGCSKLDTLNLSMFFSEKLTNCVAMFANCDRLKELNLGNFVPPAGQGSLAMFADVDMETGAISGSIPSIEKITMSGACILEPGEGTSAATATGTFFDYKETLSWSAYYQGNDTKGQLSAQSAQENPSAEPDAVLTGFDEFKTYQENHPGLTTYVFDEQPVPPGPTPGPTPTPTPDVTPASETIGLPLTGDTFAGLSWMVLAAIAGALALSTGWVLLRKREL